MNESSGEILKASFGQISLTPREVIHRRCWRGVGVASMDGPTPVLASNQEVPESSVTSAKPKSVCGLCCAADQFRTKRYD